MRRLTACIVAIGLGLSGCGDDGAAGPGDPVGRAGDDAIVLAFEDGELVGGSRAESVGLGDAVRIVVEGELDDEIHVHGYDLYLRPDDGERELVFDALIPGTFEVELEGSGRLLLRMTVS